MTAEYPTEEARRRADFTDLARHSAADLAAAVRGEADIRPFIPAGGCSFDPRSGLRVIHAATRARRPHDNQPGAADGPARHAGDGSCPVCAGKTTRAVDIAPLSRGFSFINKNLYPIFYPDQVPDPAVDFTAPPAGAGATPVWGMHFLQWPSNEHDRDIHNMPAADAAVVFERLALLEERVLHGDFPGVPATAAYEDEPHTGYSGIIKNYGHLVGGSLSHGHFQMAFTNIMPKVTAEDISFKRATGRPFVEHLRAENPPSLNLASRGRFTCVVPWFMKRPLQTMLCHTGSAGYLHHLTPADRADLAVLMGRNIAAVLALMPRLGREPAYNIIFHSGPGGPFYAEMLPYTQETGGYEHLGIFVCQGTPGQTAELYREYGLG